MKLQGGRPSIPEIEDLASLITGPSWRHYFGDWNDSACWAVCLPPDMPALDGFAWKGLRGLFGQMDEDLIWVAGRAGGITISADALASEALHVLEQRRITSVVVTDADNKVHGVLHLHDLWGVGLF